ncbi:MAG TPA: hypothetical protein PK504_04980 [Ferruginibacter sp.]|nr:hypothetical protein [Ferruginibacter sp.]HRE65084.1 hypothetical protein [Ferruginibacter sp.]
MPNKFDKLANEAQAITDAQFRERFSSLTTLNETEITKVLKSSGISKENLALLLLEIKNATEYNNKTTQSILNIQNGVGALMAIVKKLLL